MIISPGLPSGLSFLDYLLFCSILFPSLFSLLNSFLSQITLSWIYGLLDYLFFWITFSPPLPSLLDYTLQQRVIQERGYFKREGNPAEKIIQENVYP